MERVNLKLCQIMRVPADFVDVEQESEEEADFSASLFGEDQLSCEGSSETCSEEESVSQ